jgi:hypothetical protein
MLPVFWGRNGLDGGVRVLLTGEIRAGITHEIVFPLSIMEVSKKGERWIEKGACPSK